MERGVRQVHLRMVLLTLVLTSLAAAQDNADVRQPPKFTEPVSNVVQIKEPGSKTSFECKASGRPEPVMYKWYFNGEEDEGKAIVTNDIYEVDESKGVLNIQSVAPRAQGFYQCTATVQFHNFQTAVARSRKMELVVARVNPWNIQAETQRDGNEGEYEQLECVGKPEFWGPGSFKWYLVRKMGEDETIEVQPDERIFIDQEGTLHFAYLKDSDAVNQMVYSCALSTSLVRSISLGNRVDLRVNPQTGPPGPVVLQYNTVGKRVKIGQTAILECFFSGECKEVSWFDTEDKPIQAGGRVSISDFGRRLTINNVEASDEQARYCKCQGVEGKVELDVTSAPILDPPMTDQTVVEGSDVVFKCLARSMPGEPAPNQPTWRRNGAPYEMIPDETKERIKLQNNGKELVIHKANRNTDISCFRCTVVNLEGDNFNEACLNVLQPITVTEKPDAEQVIEVGDRVNLTIKAESDPLFTLTKEWTFKNSSLEQTYPKGELPPHVTWNRTSEEMYINTTGFSESQLRQIAGLYTYRMYHRYQTVNYSIAVSLKSGPVVVPVTTAGFDFWIIGLIIGILIIIIVLIIICCVVCRRKMLEGEYLVGKKEHNAGLDPEKELKDSGFHDLSRADLDDAPNKKVPLLDFDDFPEDDNDSFGSEYDQETTGFNEDGSFIDVYTKGKKSGEPKSNNVSTV